MRVYATVVSALEQEMQAEHDLRLSWYGVLVQLAEAPQGRLRLIVLANSVMMSSSGLTRLIDRMEREGLVRREPSPEDRRGIYAWITDSGRETWRRATPRHLEGVARYFSQPLDAADIAGLQITLEKILLAVSGETQSNPPVQEDLDQ